MSAVPNPSPCPSDPGQNAVVPSALGGTGSTVGSGSDTLIYPNATTGIQFAVGGATDTLKVDMLGGQIGYVYTGLAPGMFHPIRATRIYQTGTSVTGISAIY